MMHRQDPKIYVVDCIQVISGFFIILVLIKFLEQRSRGHDENIASSFVDQANKWYSMSLQDKQSMYSLQHVDYAIAYLNAARHIASDTSLERSTGLDIHKFYRKVNEHQRNIVKDLSSKLNMKSKHKHVHAQAAWLS